jgi:hypothetical protein
VAAVDARRAGVLDAFEEEGLVEPGGGLVVHMFDIWRVGCLTLTCYASSASTRPPWILYVHVGGCHRAGKRSRGVERDHALRALAEGVAACTHCRPDSELGYLE